MFSIKRFSILFLVTLVAVSAAFAQSSGSDNKREMTVEESYMQEMIELMVIRETSRAETLDQKMLALQYIGEAMERGNKSDEIRQTLEYLSMEGVMNQARENGRLVNKFPMARREAARYLSQLGTKEAEAALISICRYEPEPMVIQEAIKGLGDNASEDSAKALEAIVWIVSRFHALNPDNMMALAAIEAISKIGEKNSIRDPGVASLLLRIADGPYIRPVQNKARQVLGEMRRSGSSQN